MTAAVGAQTDARPEFRVAVFGLAAKFQRILEIVLKHARHNQYRYTVTYSRGPGHYDIALVDMTVKGGPLVARTLRRLSGALPVVTVGRRNDPNRRDDVQQATFTMQVLRALNLVVDHQLLGLLPENGQATPGGHSSLYRESAGPVAPGQLASGSVAEGVTTRAAAGVRAAAGAAASVARWAGRGAARLEPHETDSSRPRVLIVDDSPTVRRQLLEALVPMRLDVEAVTSGKEALAAVAKRSYDLIMVDVVMPDIDGYKLTRMLKKDKATRSVAVVMLTSRSSPFDLLRGALAGCNSYLVKPVSLASLKETVLRHTTRPLENDGFPAALRMA